MTEALLERPASLIGEPVLEVDSMSAWFGRRKILDRVSLAVPPRQVTAIVGARDVGKSTLLRVLSRTHEFAAGARLSGAVRLDGVDVYDRDRAEGVGEIGLVRLEPGSDVRRRLRAIVDAVVPRTRVLLLDEPCGALDPSAGCAVEDLIGRLARDVTIVLATRDARHAARVADRITHLVAEPGSASVIVDGGVTRAPARAGSQHLPGAV